jgi:hypothetical protein
LRPLRPSKATFNAVAASLTHLSWFMRGLSGHWRGSGF